MVNFLENPHKRHLIAHLLGQAMGCLLWVHTLDYIIPRELQQCMQYHVIIDHVMTVLSFVSGFMVQNHKEE